jgi:peptidoglycan L-alanyl-D-glutamate endopeptidase CwlK
MGSLTAKDLAQLEGVHPDLARVVHMAAAACPIPIRVLCGVRTVEEQARHVARGVSKTMNSKHLPQADGFSHAVDVAPYFDIDGDGKVTTPEMFSWEMYRRIAPYFKEAAAAIGVRLVWGGDWKNFPDGPHFELAGAGAGDTWAGLRLGGMLGGGEDPDYPYREDTVARSRTVQASGGIVGTLLTMLGSAFYGVEAQTLLTIVIVASAIALVLALFIGRQRILKIIDRRLG